MGHENIVNIYLKKTQLSTDGMCGIRENIVVYRRYVWYKIFLTIQTINYFDYHVVPGKIT